MKRHRSAKCCALIALALGPCRYGSAAVGLPEREPIEAMLRAEVSTGRVPGVVLLLGDAGRVQWRQAWGWRAPDLEPMTVDTVFDLASLTKVIVTTTAVLQLVERHRLQLDAPAARYWPAFGAAGKAAITLRQLLAHSSGLRAGFDPAWRGQGRAEALRWLVAERPWAAPGRSTLYSDLNFIVLGEIVQRVSGEPLQRYAQRHILGPLRMKDAGFLPPAARLPRIAPTTPGLPRGVVQDPTARRMGGVAGHAGLFGTADDLARFAQALLRPGHLLRAGTLAQLRRRQGPDAPNPTDVRTLGWQLQVPWGADPAFDAPRDAIGHTGYTGTGLWIDLAKGRFLVLLTSRLQAGRAGDARPLRREVLGILAARTRAAGVLQGREPLGGTRSSGEGVRTGIDVLLSEGFAPLMGQRIALLTHLAAVDAGGWRTLDRLRGAPGVTLVRLFSPEHGLYSDAEGAVPSGVEPLSGLPVISLYGEHGAPPPDTLQDIDALVVDLQDAGTRFFTYPATLAQAMRASARRGVRIVVLDRPNPVGAERFGGPVVDADRAAFAGRAGWPVLHGMTLGELALWIADDLRGEGLAPRVEVVRMQGYQRSMRYPQTGLAWLPPSPNLTTPLAAQLYPGVAWVEGAAISVGRGTAHPFEWVGAPWIDDAAGWADLLNAAALPGLRFTAIEFTPDRPPFAAERCRGVRIEVLDEAAVDAPRLGAWLVATLAQRWPDAFDVRSTLPLIGSQDTVNALARGVSPDEAIGSWASALTAFGRRRQGYLLY